jgi:hypothetical protein
MAPTQTAPIRTFAIVAGLCGLIGAAYGFAYATPSLGLGLVLSLLPLFAAARWFRADARVHGVSLAFDWGFLGYLVWPFYLPWYAYRTRGRRGWRPAVGVFAGVFAPHLGSLLGGVLAALTR